MNLKTECQAWSHLLCLYAENKLAPNDRAAVEQHLRGCAACREGIEQYREVNSLLAGALGPGAVRNSFNEETGQRLRHVSTGHVAAIVDDGEEEEVLAAPPGGFLDALAQRFGAAPWWVISGSFHALLILLLFLIGMAIMQVKKADTVILTSLEKQQEKEPEKDPPERDIVKNPIPVENPELVHPSPEVVMHQEVEVAEHFETEDNMDAHEAFGDEGISDIPLGGSGTSGAIGVGGGGAGAFGRPMTGGARLRRAMAGGGGKATESAVDAALDWLARHQEADGSWNCLKYVEYKGREKFSEHYDTGVTGLALLAFLGAGHTSKVGKYKTNVKKAAEWLIGQQADDGRFGPATPQGVWGFMYNHAICTLAMAEAGAMSREHRFLEAAQEGIYYLENARGPHGVWGYTPKTDRFDASVTGWAGMAMKSAKVAGLAVSDDVWPNIRKWLKTDKMDTEYQDPTIVYAEKKPMPGRKGPCITAISMLLALYSGCDAQAPGIQKGASMLAKVPPDWAQNASSKGIPGPNAPDSDKGFNNEYTWYYGTLVMFQHGGEPWKGWNEALKQALLPSQCKGGPKDGSLADKDGSWDPVNGWSASLGGRVYQTAISALSLEVYYRYLPLYR